MENKNDKPASNTVQYVIQKVKKYGMIDRYKQEQARKNPNLCQSRYKEFSPFGNE